jgi:hypothetical protein
VWSPPRLRPPHFGAAPAALPDAPDGERHGRRRWSSRRAQPVVVPEQELLTVEYSFTRAELQPVVQAIRDTLGCGAVALDTPARLQEALEALIRSVSGEGDPSVRRSPAALLTPEYWHIRLDGTNRRTLTILEDVVGRRMAR